MSIRDPKIVLKLYCRYKLNNNNNKMENNIWIECERIGNVIANEFRNKYPEATIRTAVHDYTEQLGVKLYGVFFNAEGVKITISVQHRINDWEKKPFVYLDGIHVDKDYRGRGLSTDLLNCLGGLVDRGVFNYLNYKDWNNDYWDHVKPKYPFLRDKYSDGWIFG